MHVNVLVKVCVNFFFKTFGWLHLSYIHRHMWGIHITMLLYYNTFHIYCAHNNVKMNNPLAHLCEVNNWIELFFRRFLMWWREEGLLHPRCLCVYGKVVWFFVFKEGRLFNLLMWYGFLVIRIEWSFQNIFFLYFLFVLLFFFPFRWLCVLTRKKNWNFFVRGNANSNICVQCAMFGILRIHKY